MGFTHYDLGQKRGGEIIDYSPSLADKLARNTSTHTVEEIAEEIVTLINGD